VLFDLVLELFFGHLLRPVQPGCTIKILPIPPRHLHQLRRLRPAHLFQVEFRDPRQLLVDRIR